MIIHVSRQFEKQYKKLPKTIQHQAQIKEEIFRGNPFHPVLRTHKLQGKEKEAWAFWINYSYRVTFIFLSEKEVLFFEVGTHAIYR